ncbi:acyltransferase family protein [Vibrio diabolicus]|uniref:acyltransferase family protein n=1 Tax=Vibrio diabolicus TaxID=50719 RepID=UPI0004F29F94|nr:acyltransferase [Vibrio diabolicus]
MKKISNKFSSHRDNNFGILRLVLSILVVMEHWNGLTSQHLSSFIFNAGSFAVDMFFVVSGFLIFWSFDSDGRLVPFFIKRFFRILPLYAIVILFQTLFFAINYQETFHEIVKYFIANIFFMNFLAPSVGDVLEGLQVSAINGSLWTIKNEVAFYLLVPLIHSAYNRNGLVILVVSYLLSVLYLNFVYTLDLERLVSLFPSQIRLFIVGILLYVFFEMIAKLDMLFCVLVSVLVLVLNYYVDSILIKSILVPLSTGIIMIYLAFFTRPIPLSFDFSYSLYIWHFPLIQLLLFYSLLPSNPYLSFLMVFLLVLVLAFFSEKYIETRFVRYGRGVLKSKF